MSPQAHKDQLRPPPGERRLGLPKPERLLRFARPRLGSVLLVAFLAVLVAGVVNRAATVAEASERVHADLALFARFSHPLPGAFLHVHVRSSPASDLVCARHRARPRAAADYRLCLLTRGGADRPRRLVRAYWTRMR